jgi:hypothetical protein
VLDKLQNRREDSAEDVKDFFLNVGTWLRKEGRRSGVAASLTSQDFTKTSTTSLLKAGHALDDGQSKVEHKRETRKPPSSHHSSEVMIHLERYLRINIRPIDDWTANDAVDAPALTLTPQYSSAPSSKAHG